MLLVFAVYVIKIFVIRIMGFIFDKTTAARQYIFLTCLINQVAGVGLIPIIVFVAYAPQWLSDFSVYLGAIILASTYLLRIGKGIFSNLSHRQMPAIYLLLYLCTLEVLPVLFAYKLLSEADF
jgi:hypothetical protein